MSSTFLTLMCIFSDALLEARGTTEVSSAPKPLVQKPLSTPDEDAREAEEMVNSMLGDSPLPDTVLGREAPRGRRRRKATGGDPHM